MTYNAVSPDLQRTRQIAEALDRLNSERQRVEDEILREIVERLERHPEEAKHYTLVLAGEGWHRGVIGIVAQRVVERYHRPALVMGVEDGQAVGSGRSIPGLHLFEALDAIRDLFERFGGHAQAAGFTLPAARIHDLAARFEAYARTKLSAGDLEPAQRVDGEVSLGELDWDLYQALEGLGPFGCGNPTPVLAAHGLSLLVPPRVLREKHLKLRVAQGNKSFDALAWRWADKGRALMPGQTLDLAFTLDQNVYQNIATLQLVVKDIRTMMNYE